MRSPSSLSAWASSNNSLQMSHLQSEEYINDQWSNLSIFWVMPFTKQCLRICSTKGCHEVVKTVTEPIDLLLFGNLQRTLLHRIHFKSFCILYCGIKEMLDVVFVFSFSFLENPTEVISKQIYIFFCKLLCDMPIFYPQ